MQGESAHRQVLVYTIIFSLIIAVIAYWQIWLSNQSVLQKDNNTVPVRIDLNSIF